jgi:nucleotide-binding universal stress UspA family protein
MALFQTLLHPTDFDEPSKEAFRVARSLAQVLGSQVVVFHVVSPPAIVTQDGRVILDKHSKEPTDLWAGYRTLAADTPTVPVSYGVLVGDKSDARYLLEERIRELGEGVLVVVGTHGRTGLSRLLWGNTVEKIVRDPVCPVLVVKAPAPTTPGPTPTAEEAGP